MSPLSARRVSLLCCVGAATLAAALYANSLRGPFLYDDIVEIRDNERVHALSNAPDLATSDFWGAGAGRNPLYRPLTAITVTALFVAGGGSPWPFHLLNLILHAVASGLAVLLLTQITRRWDVALVGGALFAAHPIHTEAVAWISGIGELISAVGVLGAWIAHLRGRSALAAVVFASAVLSKESAVVYPLLVIAGDSMARDGPVRARWRTYAAYAAVLAGYLTLRWMVLGHLLGGSGEAARLLNPLRDVSALDRILTSGVVLGLAMRQASAPAALCLDYGYNQIPVAAGLTDLRLLVSVLMLVAVAALILIAPGRRRPLLQGALVFFVSFLPVSNLFFPAISIFAERNLYLPALGACLMAACWLRPAQAGLVGVPAGGGSLASKAGWTAAALLVLMGGARTFARNIDFGDPLRLYASAARACPASARAHSFHGIALREAGRPAEAAEQQRASLAIRPDYAAARAELGLSLLQSGDASAAERELVEALRQDPTEREARSNLAWIYAETGRLGEALEQYRIARDLFPADPEVIGNYAGALLDAGRVEEARALFERLRSDHPASPRGPIGLGALHALEGRWDLAAEAFAEGLRRKPGDLNATHNLALALARSGRAKDAIELLDRAISEGPTDPALQRLRDSLRDGGAPAPH